MMDAQAPAVRWLQMAGRFAGELREEHPADVLRVLVYSLVQTSTWPEAEWVEGTDRTSPLVERWFQEGRKAGWMTADFIMAGAFWLGMISLALRQEAEL